MRKKQADKAENAQKFETLPGKAFELIQKEKKTGRKRKRNFFADRNFDRGAVPEKVRERKKRPEGEKLFGMADGET